MVVIFNESASEQPFSCLIKLINIMIERIFAEQADDCVLVATEAES